MIHTGISNRRRYRGDGGNAVSGSRASRRRPYRALNEYDEYGTFDVDDFDYFLNGQDASVVIRSSSGRTGYRENDVEEVWADFIEKCRRIVRSSRGTGEIIRSKEYPLAYKLYVEDSNGREYAEMDFYIVYFNDRTASYLDRMVESRSPRRY